MFACGAVLGAGNGVGVVAGYCAGMLGGSSSGSMMLTVVSVGDMSRVRCGDWLSSSMMVGICGVVLVLLAV